MVFWTKELTKSGNIFVVFPIPVSDRFASGHYAQSSRSNYESDDSPNFLCAAVDEMKDQSFYLSRLSPQQIQKLIFPIGDLNKNVVKSIALQSGFDKFARQKESQGICFVGKRSNMGSFLTEYLPRGEPGRIYELGTG